MIKANEAKQREIDQIQRDSALLEKRAADSHKKATLPRDVSKNTLKEGGMNITSSSLLDVTGNELEINETIKPDESKVSAPKTDKIDSDFQALLKQKSGNRLDKSDNLNSRNQEVEKQKKRGGIKSQTQGFAKETFMTEDNNSK